MTEIRTCASTCEAYYFSDKTHANTLSMCAIKIVNMAFPLVCTYSNAGHHKPHTDKFSINSEKWSKRMRFRWGKRYSNDGNNKQGQFLTTGGNKTIVINPILLLVPAVLNSFSHYVIASEWVMMAFSHHLLPVSI